MKSRCGRHRRRRPRPYRRAMPSRPRVLVQRWRRSAGCWSRRSRVALFAAWLLTGTPAEVAVGARARLLVRRCRAVARASRRRARPALGRRARRTDRAGAAAGRIRRDRERSPCWSRVFGVAAHAGPVLRWLDLGSARAPRSPSWRTSSPCAAHLTFPQFGPLDRRVLHQPGRRAAAHEPAADRRVRRRLAARLPGRAPARRSSRSRRALGAGLARVLRRERRGGAGPTESPGAGAAADPDAADLRRRRSRRCSRCCASSPWR